MLDLRKNVVDLRRQIVSYNIKPTDSKCGDFHSALAEYLYKELKMSGLNVSKHHVILKVALKNKHEDKYENIIIDCLEGNLYLRGKEIKDKYFGKLRRFTGGQRPSDAYHCAIQSASRIISRINKLQEEFNQLEREVLGQEIELERLDLRNKNVKDLRQKTASINRIDLRKKVNIERKDLRKVSNRKDLRKTAINKVAMDLSFINDLANNLQSIYTSVQNIASNNDVQSALNFIAQYGDDVMQNLPALKNLKPAIDYIANFINSFQNQGAEVIKEVNTVRTFPYEMIDTSVASSNRQDLRKIARKDIRKKIS